MVDALVIPLMFIGTLLGMSALVIIASTIHHYVKVWRTRGAEMAQREKEERDYVDTMKDRDDPMPDEEPDSLEMTDQRFEELHKQLDDTLSQEGLTPEEWWEDQSTEEKSRWLSAYYAELSGQLRVIEARGRPCRHCDARGYMEGTDDKGEVIRITCPICKDLKFERLVRCR